MSDINQIVTLHVKGVVIIEFSPNPPSPPSTPAASTGGTSSTPVRAAVNSSAPRQPPPVYDQELAREYYGVDSSESRN